MLLLHDLSPYHWAIGGLLIGVITVLMLALGGQRLGVSTGFENVCALVSRAPYFRREEIFGSHGWRLPFLGGLVMGGVLSAVFGGGWRPIWNLGMFDEHIGFGHAGKLLWMFAGGLLIGFGTRMAGGCTSGHGIFGISNFEKASVTSTLSFLMAGTITSNLIFRVIFGAQ